MNITIPSSWFRTASSSRALVRQKQTISQTIPEIWKKVAHAPKSAEMWADPIIFFARCARAQQRVSQQIPLPIFISVSFDPYSSRSSTLEPSFSSFAFLNAPHFPQSPIQPSDAEPTLGNSFCINMRASPSPLPPIFPLFEKTAPFNKLASRPLPSPVQLTIFLRRDDASSRVHIWPPRLSGCRPDDLRLDSRQQCCRLRSPGISLPDHPLRKHACHLSVHAHCGGCRHLHGRVLVRRNNAQQQRLFALIVVRLPSIQLISDCFDCRGRARRHHHRVHHKLAWARVQY